MFSLSTFGLPYELHSQRVSAVCIFLYGLYCCSKNKKSLFRVKSSRDFVQYTIMCIMLLLYSFILLAIVGKKEGDHMFETMANICLFTLPVTWGLVNIFDNIEEFMKTLVIVGLIQSVIICYCLVDESFAFMLDVSFNDVGGSDYSSGHRSGYAGGLGCITAPGVIKYSTGLLAVCYLYNKTRKSYLLVIFLLFSILSSMIARTGLLIDVVCLAYIIKTSAKTKQMIGFIIPIVFLSLLVYSLVSSGNYDDFIAERYRRMADLNEGGVDSFFGGYFSGSFPDLSFRSFCLGVGMVSGISGTGDIVHVDGGPLRIYSAIGFIFTVCVYLFFIKIMCKNIFKQRCLDDKLFMLTVLFVYFIAEFKEFTFFTIWAMSIYFCIVLLINRTNKSNVVYGL